MKKRIKNFTIGICCCCLLFLQACGQIVETEVSTFPENLIGKSYPANADPDYLQTYSSLGGSLITPVHLEEQVIVAVYQKDSSHLVLFCQRASDQDSFYTIKKVLLINQIPEGCYLVHALCRVNRIDQPGVVAIMKPGEEYSKDIKQAWLYDWVDDVLVEVDANEVDCYNEYFDLTKYNSSFLNNT